MGRKDGEISRLRAPAPTQGGRIDDPLADLLAASLRGDDDDTCSWYEAEGAQAADTIRAALADGALPLRAVLPPEVADVLDAAVAFHDDLAPRLSGAREGTPLAHFLAAVEALPEHLRGGS